MHLRNSRPKPDRGTAPLNERIPYWIEQLEQQANRFLAAINPEELPPKERAAIALRILSQLQWFLAFSHQLGADAPPSEESFEATLSSLMRQMRGEGEEGEERE